MQTVDQDQTPRSAYCLPMSLLWDARRKWVKQDTMIKANSQNSY